MGPHLGQLRREALDLGAQGGELGADVVRRRTRRQLGNPVIRRHI